MRLSTVLFASFAFTAAPAAQARPGFVWHPDGTAADPLALPAAVARPWITAETVGLGAQADTLGLVAAECAWLRVGS